MEKQTQPIESLLLRSATVVDRAKVQYRVYTSASDFKTVVAESALMAVRVAGVEVPYKIVRDMADENGLIQSSRLQKEEKPATVQTSLELKERLDQHFAELGPAPEGEEEALLFVPIGLADLRSRGTTRARILPAELLHQIIEEYKNKQAEPEPQAAPEDLTADLAAREQKILDELNAIAPPSSIPAEMHTPPVDQMENLPEGAEPPSSFPDLMERPPVASAAERLTEMAREVLPASPIIPALDPDRPVLTEEDVEKLLNG